MSIQVGDIDLANEIIELHYQVARTQLIIEFLINNATTIIKPSAADLSKIDSRALELVQKKFPNMGIQKKA